jgi:hypothetical protein
MKKLYEFVSYQVQKVEEKVPSKNDKGEEIVEIKISDKKVPQKFFLRKPNRSLIDDAELYYGIQYSIAVKEGLLTKAQLASKFADEAKTFSRTEQEKYTQNYFLLFEKEGELQKLQLKKKEERTPEEEKVIEELVKSMLALKQELQDFEIQQSSLFDHTAEVRARNKTILWWTCHLSHKEDSSPLFGLGTYQDKLAKYDEIEENEDEFLLNVVKKILFVVSFWYTGRADKQEEFDRVLESAGLKE